MFASARKALSSESTVYADDAVPALPQSVQAEAEKARESLPSLDEVTASAAWPAPGSFDDFARASDDILQFDQFSAFEGMKFELHRQVTAPLNVSHVVHLVPPKRDQGSTYSFAAILADAKQSNFLVGKLDSTLDMFARCQLAPASWWTMRAMHHSTPKDDVGDWQLESDLTPSKSTLVNLKYVNQSQAQVSLTQSLGQNLAVGTQVAHSTEKGTFVAAGARYTHKDLTASALALSYGAMLNFALTRKVSDKLSLSTDYTLFPSEMGGRDSVYSAGWEFRFNNALAKAKVDSNGNVVSYVEELLNPFIQAKFSASLNHSKEEYKFGLGVAAHT